MFGEVCLVFDNIICRLFIMYCLAPYTVPLGPTLNDQINVLIDQSHISLLIKSNMALTDQRTWPLSEHHGLD